jgi:hypothetical protein
MRILWLSKMPIYNTGLDMLFERLDYQFYIRALAGIQFVSSIDSLHINASFCTITT